MSVGFGFSVDDFINATKLVSTVIDALREDGEAGKEFRELLNQLYSLETALIRVKGLELDESQNAEFLALKQAAAQCQRTMDEFWEKTRPFQKNLGLFVTKTSRLKDKWMRVKWAVCKKEDVVRLKADLAGHTASIHLLLSTLQIESMSLQTKRQYERQQTLAGRIQNSYFQCMQTLSTISTQVTSSLDIGRKLLEMTAQVVRTNIQVFQIVLRLQDSITQVTRQQPVYLIDALGRICPFHLEFIRSKEALKAVLAINFEKFGAADKIMLGEFAIEDTVSNKDVELDADWDLAFVPGQRVEMSMIFNRLAPATICPKCRKICHSDHARDIQCSMCGFIFRRVVDLESNDSRSRYSPYSRRLTSTFGVPSEASSMKMKRKAEENPGLFRKVRLISNLQLFSNILSRSRPVSRDSVECYIDSGGCWGYLGKGHLFVYRLDSETPSNWHIIIKCEKDIRKVIMHSKISSPSDVVLDEEQKMGLIDSRNEYHVFAHISGIESWLSVPQTSANHRESKVKGHHLRLKDFAQYYHSRKNTKTKLDN